MREGKRWLLDERLQLAEMQATGKTIQEIATELQRTVTGVEAFLKKQRTQENYDKEQKKAEELARRYEKPDEGWLSNDEQLQFHKKAKLANEKFAKLMAQEGVKQQTVTDASTCQPIKIHGYTQLLTKSHLA